MKFASLIFLLFAAAAEAATLPGFRVERLGPTDGFPSSLAIDSTGRIFYTTTDGSLFRFMPGASTRIATVDTDSAGNSGLLGMALLDDDTAVVHYTTPQQTHDVVSLIDLRDGNETILHRFVTDIEFPGRQSPSEHHGGNPSVAPDGTIFVGIGDYSWHLIAPDPAWNGGKIYRLTRDGMITQFARGVRNPFDMFWDSARSRLIVADNGPTAGDEIHVISDNSDCGWPHTYGKLPPVEGSSPPQYVFPTTVAPTGMTRIDDDAFLLGAFVSRAIYYFTLDANRVTEPLTLIEKETPSVIDIARGSDGKIFFATGGFSEGTTSVYRLHLPARGDCNGDSLVSSADRDALNAELTDGVMQPVTAVHNGAHRSSWGCDTDGDRLVTAADAAELAKMLGWRRRAARK